MCGEYSTQPFVVLDKEGVFCLLLDSQTFWHKVTLQGLHVHMCVNIYTQTHAQMQARNSPSLSCLDTSSQAS